MKSDTDAEAPMHYIEELERWVIGHSKISDTEFEFYLVNFPISKVRIKVYQIPDSSLFLAVTDHKIKSTKTSYSILPIGKSHDPNQAIAITLIKFINNGNVVECEENPEYSKESF
jgi:hypothetical protein